MLDLTPKTLVTGAAGFIGSHLTEALAARGQRVRAMVHYNFQNSWGWLETLPPELMERIEVFPADIGDPFAVRKAVAGCKKVFHLASLIAIPYSYRAPASYVDTNVKGTLNVLQACLDEGIDRVVHTSTSETYGSAQYVPIDEAHPLVGQSPYSASKIAADKLAESYYLSFDLPVATIRPFNTFGPRQSARAIIPTIITQALTGAETIRLGALHPVRDLNYVADTVEGFLAVANTDGAVGTVTNVGRGEGVSVGELAELILELCGSNARVESQSDRLRPEKSEVQRLICDNRKAQSLLGWSPRHSLRDGLQATIAWMRDNLDRYKPGLYNV
jgi:dTDP-glucose 4,6-dehydratase